MADETTDPKETTEEAVVASDASEKPSDAPQGASGPEGGSLPADADKAAKTEAKTEAKPEPPINMTEEPIAITQAQATQTVSTDAANEKNGAALEGAVLDSPPPVVLGSAPKTWGADGTGENAVDNTFYYKAPVYNAGSIIPSSAPAGWVRDTDGSLWDAKSITGLTIESEGAGRYFVRAHTASGLKTLSIHTAHRSLAEAHLESAAYRIAGAKGFYPGVGEEEAVPEEVSSEETSSDEPSTPAKTKSKK